MGPQSKPLKRLANVAGALGAGFRRDACLKHDAGCMTLLEPRSPALPLTEIGGTDRV